MAIIPPQGELDLALVHRAKAGEFEAFEELVSRHEGALYALARRMLGNEANAQDVVQSTFVSVIEHLGEFEERASFRTWIVRIATNHALKLMRRKRSGGEMVELEAEGPVPHPEFIAPWRDDPARIAEGEEARAILAQAIDSLEDIYRTVFVLRDVEGLSTQETAEALGISQANVKVRLLRGRLMLREKLTRLFGDPERRVMGGHEHGTGEGL